MDKPVADKQETKEEEKTVIEYEDLYYLANALSIASNSHLMSLEEARMLWKLNLVAVGWKKKPKTQKRKERKPEGGEKKNA